MKSIVQRAKDGERPRNKQGYRLEWKSTPPTPEEIEEAQNSINGIRSYCPVCETYFAVPSVATVIREHGRCSFTCQDFLDGQTEGIILQRMPTVDEVLEVPQRDLTSMEVGVMRSALLRMRQ